jgi:hypothetical protein
MKSLYCLMNRIIQIVTLQFFLLLTTETNIEKPSFCWHSDNSEGRDKQLCSIVERATQDCLKDHQQRRKRRIDADGGCFEGYSLHQSVSKPSVLEHSGDTLYYDCALANFL